MTGKKKLIVIGGGAAGFFCAVNAARIHPSLQVTLLEKSGKLLSKVKVSGGGRCNVTHSCSGIADMARNYPRGTSFLKKAFHQFFVDDTIRWFEERNVPIKTEADGRMFPVSDNSQSIMDCLLKEASIYNVEVLMNRQVVSITKKEEHFILDTGSGRTETADFVCIACGGIPKLLQFEWMKELKHTVQPPVPSLFTFNLAGNPITSLMGISVEASVKIAGTKLSETGSLLITHWGLSGPAVLKLSAWGARELAAFNYKFRIVINWLPSFNENTIRQECIRLRQEIGSRKMINNNPFQLPSRLWEYLLNQAGIDGDTRWADLSAKNQNGLSKILCTQDYEVNGKTTFKEEFVTAGGISLDEVNPETMESRLSRNLYFAGEVLDIDGITGGFNFQSAWTTGWIAANRLVV